MRSLSFLYYSILISLFSCSEGVNEDKRVLYTYINNDTTQLIQVCDSSAIFGNQTPGCDYEIYVNSEPISQNDIINRYSHYYIHDDRIVFYSSYRFGALAGWFLIENGQQREFTDFKSDNESLLLSDTVYYRNGLFLSETDPHNVVLGLQSTLSIPIPEYESTFGIYKLDDSSRLNLITTDFKHDIFQNDGLYYITLPGLIEHFEYVMK